MLRERSGLLQSKHINKILDLIPFPEEVRHDFLRKWGPGGKTSEGAEGSESVRRWKEVEKKINAEATKMSASNKKAASLLRRAAMEVVGASLNLRRPSGFRRLKPPHRLRGGRARPRCKHCTIRPCGCLGSAFEGTVFQTLTP